VPGGVLEEIDGERRSTLVYIGRLSPEKNVEVLLEAVARLRQRGVELRLLLAGEGPEREALEAVVASRRLGDRVRFLGFQSDTFGLLRRAGAFVLPSRTEGVPMALLEAMAAGVPVVASAVGGIPGVTGGDALLVAPGDAGALADALERVLTDAALATVLRRGARRRYLDEFTVGRMADRYLAFYQSVLP
jgi:glycosyltransferase involved in cell wall biosynthesis